MTGTYRGGMLVASTTPMDSLEIIVREIDSIERNLNRRRFLQSVVFVSLGSRSSLDVSDREFLRKVAASLIPPDALKSTGIDVVANIHRLLDQGSAEHRNKVLRFLSWCRRISFLYGGDQIALRSRQSRFVLPQRMGKALSSLCLVAFWGDARALNLITLPEEKL